MTTTIRVPDDPKAIRETLCVAQGAVIRSPVDEYRRKRDVDLLSRFIAECDRHRPLGPDGKHGDRHTATCGCEDKPTVTLRLDNSDGRYDPAEPSRLLQPQPEAIIRRHPGAWLNRYSVRVVDGLIVYQSPTDGRYACTHAGAERKARRLLARYLRRSATERGEYDEALSREATP